MFELATIFCLLSLRAQVLPRQVLEDLFRKCEAVLHELDELVLLLVGGILSLRPDVQDQLVSHSLVVRLKLVELGQEQLVDDPAEVLLKTNLDFSRELDELCLSLWPLRLRAGAHLGHILLVELHDPVVHGLDQAENLFVLLQTSQGCGERGSAKHLLHCLLNTPVNSFVGALDVRENLPVHWRIQLWVAQHRCLSNELAQGDARLNVRPK